MLEIKELKKMLKEMLLFYVLQLQMMVTLMHSHHKCVKYSITTSSLTEFQFFVSGSGFSVLAREPEYFNSLYWASGSLKS